MGLSKARVSDSFGFMTSNYLHEQKICNKFSNENNGAKYNAFIVLSYIPVIGGLFTAAMRMVSAIGVLRESRISSETNKGRWAFCQIARGIFEGLGAGLLFLIPDIIATIARFSARKDEA